MALALFAAAHSALVSAVIPGPPVDGLEVSVVPIHTHYHSEESDASGRLYDTESGALEGCEGQLLLPLWGGYAMVSAQREFGGLAYQGSTEAGSPVLASTQLIIEEYAAGWSHVLLPPGPVNVSGSVQVGQRRIDRAIGATTTSLPLHEVLEWPWLRLGVSADMAVGSRFVVTAGLFGERGLGHDTLRVDFGTFAAPVEVRPATRYAVGASLLTRYTVDRHWSAGLWAETTRQRYGASESVEYYRNGSGAGQARYPGSTQWLDTVGIDLAYRF